MHATLDELLTRFRQAASPESLFGAEDTLSLMDLKIRYRQLARQVHPDYNPQALDKATEAFLLLQRWYALAQQQIGQGSYGRVMRILVESATHRYEGKSAAVCGDLADLYPAHAEDSSDVLLKVVRAAHNNDLMLAEVNALKRLDQALQGDPLRAHFPTLIEHFQIHDQGNVQRQSNVLRREVDTVTLAEVKRAYPTGIAAADMAWIFNRLLAALAITHAQGIVHGAVTPDHLLLRLADHNGILIDWCYSVDIGQSIAAISPPYRAFYPPEVLAKQPATAATDLYMAAQCMVAILGGDVASGQLPSTTPRPIAALLQSCLIPSPHRRAHSAWDLFGEFREILRRLYGAPKFRPFSMQPLAGT